MFIVFETAKYWWSIEKNTEGITIQRSTQKPAVTNYHLGKRRNKGEQVMQEDKSRKTVFDFIDWLYNEGEPSRHYDTLNSNCKHFATAAFNHIASSKQIYLTS